MGTLFPLNSTWHFKLLSIYFIVYFFTFSMLYCQRFWIIKINQQPGTEPDTTYKEPGAFDIPPILGGCITQIYWYGKIWAAQRRKKKEKNNNTPAHFCKKLIGTVNEQMATISASKHLFDSLFGDQQRQRRAQDTLLPCWVNHQELHQRQWCYTSVTKEGSLRMTENIWAPYIKTTLKAWLQIQSYSLNGVRIRNIFA